MLLSKEELKILNDIFYNNNLYLTGLNKFNIAFNKSGIYRVARNYPNQCNSGFMAVIRFDEKLSLTSLFFNMCKVRKFIFFQKDFP